MEKSVRRPVSRSREGMAADVRATRSKPGWDIRVHFRRKRIPWGEKE